jgi:tetratricopeptide (TPR) repeat protein
VETYRDDPRPLPEKAAELGVAYVAECSVQKAPDSEEIRITVRLLDASGESVWGDTYDQDLSTASYFDMLGDVAQQFASGLGTFLTPQEADLLAVQATESSEAWDLYLRGRDYYTRPGYGDANFQIAEGLWERAIELDPEFALARAKLSYLHGRTAFLGRDRSPERYAAQEREASEALRLQPNLPEAQFARGYVAYVKGDLQEALEYFRLAQEGAPNDAVTSAFTGYAYRRQGTWEDWERTWRRTLELNPRNPDMYFNLGGHTLTYLRRYSEALEAYRRALELAPDLNGAALRKGWVYAYWEGQLDTLRAVVASLPGDVTLLTRIDLALMDRNWDEVLELTDSGPDVSVSQYRISSRHLIRGRAFRSGAEDDSAVEAFRTARVALERYLAENPEDHRVHYGLGMAYAGLGMMEEAVRSAERYRQEAPYPPEDVYFISGIVGNTAEILAQAGLAEQAVECLRESYGMGRRLSSSVNRIFGDSTLWDPIRDHPVFQDFLEEVGSPESDLER